MEKNGAQKPLLCRLCSAKRNLISLFKSSDSIYRCNIKKLIAQVVSIQYEKGDGLKYVCCSCVIRTYNCYVFKVKCLENEQKLKNSFPHLNESNLPSLEVLRESVMWLYNKSKLSLTVKVNGSVTTDNSTDTLNESDNAKASTPVMVDESVQTVPPKTFNVGVSAYIPSISYFKDDKSTQTKLVSMENVSISCSIPNCGIKNIQKHAQLKQAKGKDTFKSTKNKDYLFLDETSQFDVDESSRELDQAVESNRKRKHKSSHNNNAANKLFKTDYHNNNAKKGFDDVTENLEIQINEQIALEPLDIKSEPLSPAPVTSCSSFAPVENSLQFTNKVEYLKNCQECGILLHTKEDALEHRKTHMKCYLCKKRFRSIKKAKEHMNSSCIRNICSKEPVISIEKLGEEWI